MRQGVAELTALVDRPRRLGRGVARDPARKAELLEQSPHPVLVLRDVRIDLAVGAFEPSVGDHPGTAMAGAADVDHVEAARLDDAIEVHVDEIEAGCRPPVAEQPRLDVGAFQRPFEQWIVEEIDLADRQIICRPPPRVDQVQFRRRQRLRRRLGSLFPRHLGTSMLNSGFCRQARRRLVTVD